MDYVNEIGKILLTSPLIMAGVQIIKALWKDYDPKWIPYLSIATGICAGIIWSFGSTVQPEWLKWVIGIASGVPAGLAASGLWETVKVASKQVLDKDKHLE